MTKRNFYRRIRSFLFIPLVISPLYCLLASVYCVVRVLCKRFHQKKKKKEKRQKCSRLHELKKCSRARKFVLTLLECSHNEVLCHFPAHFSFFLHNISRICTVFVDPLHSKFKKFAQHKKCADTFLCHFSLEIS